MNRGLLYTILVCLFYVSVTKAQVKPDKGDEQGMEVGKLDLKQDSLAVRDALDGWWKNSEETLNNRMSWYEEAKFGCFIHWGVYSVAGGEWKGNVVSGYSEHLMRKEKISVEEYKSLLVKSFNPVKFNADEWMLHAKKAGMRYFIVTAKHHDGFAMFYSDAYPYDMRMTMFDRDPMKELSDAAKKYGIKFGFYYSHAFDWEHPDAPGNDWDYNNPGGDKLICGSNWWLKCPEFLVKAEHYVTEKSIPQIVELIKKYDPDILWFDTPHKLPLYENIRILKSIRETNPDIVVNGRLARFGSNNLGDYRNTGDRAAFFYPVDGNWESIPTTNESYGYSKHDNSHKSVTHFIRLLASATSKGGNILMNVGPKGNGEWDEKDITIFNGVGEWLKVYGEAIYGNVKTDLPIQTWGVTTRKDKNTYLHVYDWPVDGKLVLGGLTSNVDKVWIVSDNHQKLLKTVRLNDKDISIEIPLPAPDKKNTVIAMTTLNDIPPYPVRLIDTMKENILYAFDAQLTGKGLKYGDGKNARNYVTGWSSNNQCLDWKFRLNESAEYNLYIEYNTASNNESGVVSVKIGGTEFDVKYTPWLEKNGSNSIHIGKVKLNSGESVCFLTGKEFSGNEYMRPISIRLIPVLENK